MKKKGFTLIELLAVIAILAVISLISTPIILNIVEDAKKKTFSDSVYGVMKATKIALANENFEETHESVLTVNFSTGTNVDKLNLKGNIPENGYITIDEEEKIELLISNGKYCAKKSYDDDDITVEKYDESTCKFEYKESILNGSDPKITGELIPVTISDDGTVTKANLSEQWYKYEDKKWANAVILKDDGKVEDDGTIKEESIESYFVWIPRYKYQIFDLGEYTSYSGTTKPEESNAKEIQIVFGTDTTSDDIDGECTTPLTSGGTGNCEVGDYMTHPAFIAFDTTGIWVGKFETTGTIDSVTIKPGIQSLRSQTVKTIFETSYNYNRDLESHMMKNTEWGAVAYLSHSKYGINTEININNNSEYLTGYSAVEGTDQSDNPGTYGTDSSVTLAYNTETGYKASTTGNITGIYDMSGGTHEYMASYIDEQYGDSGFTSDPITTYGKKYFDKYNSTSTWRSFNNRILGDATGEMGPFYQYADGDGTTINHNSWYADSSYFVESSEPWFHRGSNCYSGVLAGQFYFARNTGGSGDGLAFRMVLAP